MKKLIILLFILTGCATAGKINRLSLGMTKAQVIDELGDPDSTKANEGIECLVYNKYASGVDSWAGRNTEYWVVIKENKVIQYGKAGDFGNSLPKTEKIILEHNVNVNTNGK